MLPVTAVSFGQQKVFTQAIVNTTTNIIAPENEDVQPNPGGGGMNFRNMMDGETKFTTYLKNDLVKTVIKSEMGRGTIIRNNSTKLTTTLLEIMGTKQGFYVSDSEQVILRKKTDSLMRSRRNRDSSASATQEHTEPVVEIRNTTDTKKIAGYTCRKSYLITTRLLGFKDTAIVWYCPDIKLQNVAYTGGLSGFGSISTVNGLDKFDGFVMRYEMSIRNNRRMEVEVTKIDTGKDIADKEFDIPKDFDMKPMREMQNMFGGRGMPRPN